MVLRGQLCEPHIDDGMASDQPVKKKQRIDGPDIDDNSDRCADDILTDIFESETPPADTSDNAAMYYSNIQKWYKIKRNVHFPEIYGKAYPAKLCYTKMEARISYKRAYVICQDAN